MPKDFILAPTGGKILFSIASGFNPRQLKKDWKEGGNKDYVVGKRFASNRDTVYKSIFLIIYQF